MNVDRLSHLRRPEPLRRDTALAQRLCQFAHRLGDSLRGQLERAEMHGDALARRQIEARLYGFGRIHVNLLHEPAWLVGPDGEEREVDPAQPRGDVPKTGALAP